jgi:hypothetical protein
MPDTAMLDSCRDLVAARLAEELAHTLTRVVGELTELAGRMPSQGMYILYMDSMELTRNKGAFITASFKKNFFTRYNEEKNRSHGGPGLHELDASNLSLQEPDDLEESLAANTVANAIANTCGEELFGLGKRMGVLLDDPDLKLEQNPLGPNAIGVALLDALKDQNASVKIKLMLVTRINKHFPAQVRAVYQEINRYLVERNILPTIRLSMARGAPPSMPALAMAAGSAAGDAGAYAGGGASVSGQDMFAVLQQLMAYGHARVSHLGIPGLPMPAGLATGNKGDNVVGQARGGGQSIDPALLRTLTQIQQGHLEGVDMGALNAGQLADGQVNVLRELQHTQAAGMLGQMEAMTLDIVVLVFDYILGDNRIPDAMKALIGRLQIPVLKVTMLDKSFFSQKAHPARRLLDLLAEAALGWDPTEGHESSLYRKIREIVQRILDQFDDRLDVFSEAVSEFQAYQADEKQSSDELTSRSAQFLRDREQHELARVIAHDAVASSLLDQPTPTPIRQFLLGHWEARLAQVHVEKGEGSPDWDSTVTTMNELIWSLSPKTDKEERRKLIDLLPRLLKRLDAGIHALGLGGTARDAFFSDLVKCHAVAVKAGFHGDPGAAAAAMASAQAVVAELPSAQATATALDFEDIPVLTEEVAPDPVLLREIAAVQSEPDADVEEITISGVRGEAWDEPGDGHFETLVKHLKRGVWIDFTQDDGNLLRAKLAWISPLQGTYLFTNRLGQRAVSINAKGLAAKFRENHAKVIDNVPLIDRAVNNVFAHFQRGVRGRDGAPG